MSGGEGLYPSYIATSLFGCYLNVAVSIWVIQNDVDTETTAVRDLWRQWNRDSETACGE